MPKKSARKLASSKQGCSAARSSKNYSNDDRRSLIDSLFQQSQIENMGYGDDACPKCGVSGFEDGCLHCGSDPG